MQLSTATERALQGWIGPSTWHTSHDLDMERWYKFVDQYQRDHGYTINEPELQAHIEGKSTTPMNDYLKGTIRERISLAYKILDFLRTTNR